MTTVPTDPDPDVDPTRRIDRWCLPVPDGRVMYAAVKVGSGSIYPAQGSRWIGTDADGLDVDLDVQVQSSARYERIIAARPLASLTRLGAQPMIDGAITLRDPSTESAAAALSIDRATYDALPGGDDGCTAFPTKGHYHVERIPDPDQGPPVWHHDVTGCHPVPLEWEDPPELPEHLRWVPSPAFLALWGPVAAPHLLPGALHGMRWPIMERVDAHPWVRSWMTRLHDGPPHVDRDGKAVHFYFDRRIEGDPTVTKQVKPTPRSRRTVPQVRPVYQTVDVKAPAPDDTIAAPSLAAALAQLDDIVADRADALLPPEGRVCGHCNGVGIVVGDEPATVPS